jgi:hypothetical protein
MRRHAKSQFYAYYGGTYFDKNYTMVSPGNYVGFGFPGSTSANRQFQEPMFGYYYTFWKNPKYGALQIDHAVLLSDAGAVVRCAGHADHGAREHGFRRAALHAAIGVASPVLQR